MDPLPLANTSTQETSIQYAPIPDTGDPHQTNAVVESDSAKRKRKSEGTLGDLGLDRPIDKRPKSSYRHVKHWDLEGDLFLRMNDCWMRLRKSGLLRHSEWFSDVFAAIEQGRIVADPKRPYMEGTMVIVDVKNVQRCYHVPALGVSAMDFGLLLSALDDAISYCHNPPAFPVLSAILRASTELKFPMFRDWATRSIQKMWPSSLAALSTALIPHATESVILGRAWGVSGILKRSLYELLRTPGFGQDNSDTLHRHPAPYEHSRLLPADILCLVNAREQLDLVWYRATAFDVRLVHDTGLFQNFRFDVLCGLAMLVQIDWESESAGVCPLCVAKLREKWETEREQTWGRLDGLFRLDNPAAV
ncbi:hypothetical protein DFH06DRAFT_1469944 [Mycena polygramma]|nr:hypothetical protein DFH06DRAFT_1469944 [Mycena polygramma]